MNTASPSASRLSVRLAVALPLLVALLTGASAFYWAAKDWYFANTDAAAFVPPMLSHARDGELINTFQPSARDWDPQGIGRQVGHGFLPSLFTGSVVPEATYRNIHYAIAGQIAFGLLLLALLLNRHHSPRPGHLLRDSTLNALTVLAASQILFRLEGRPEVFAFWLTALAVLLAENRPQWIQHAIAGLLLSALAVTSPVAAIFVGLAFVARLAATETFLPSLRSLFLAGGVTMVGLWLWFALYPYRFAEWIEGNLRHASAAIGDQPAIPILGWFTSFTSGFNGTLFLAGALAALALLWLHRQSWSQRGALSLAVACFALACWYFVFRQGFAIYNAQWLIPFGLIAVLIVSGRITPTALRTVTACLLFAFVGNAALMSIRDQVLRHASLTGGPSPDEVRLVVKTLQEASPRAGGQISTQYFHLFDDSDKLLRLHREVLERDAFPPPSFIDFALVSQTDRRKKTPTDYIGWKLVHHTFSPRSLHLGRLDLGVSPRGFNYALYLPEAVPVPPALSAVLSQLQASGSESSASNQ